MEPKKKQTIPLYESTWSWAKKTAKMLRQNRRPRNFQADIIQLALDFFRKFFDIGPDGSIILPKIEIRKGKAGIGWVASLSANKDIWEFGETYEGAVGKLVISLGLVEIEQCDE